MIFGTNGDNTLRRFGKRRFHGFQNMDARIAGIFQSLGQNFHRKAVNFHVHLHARHTIVCSGNFQIHVAVVVFGALDIGEDFEIFYVRCAVSVRSHHEPHRNTCGGFLQGHARVHERKDDAQTVAIEDDPLEDMISETTRMV